jgi:putative colanic acid biosynthesis glycosyltransferase WcaI
MRLLIFSQHFPPETAATGRRALSLAESLSARGDEVTVITGMPNHPSSVSQWFCHRAKNEEGSRPGYRVLRVPVFRSPDPKTLKRLLTYGTFMVSAGWRGLKVGRPDAIVAISPLPTGLGAVPARFWHSAPLIYDLQDIWPASVLSVGVLKRGLLMRLLEGVEQIFYRCCSAAAVISDGFKSYLVKRGLPPDLVRVIPNCVDCEMFANGRPDSKIKVVPQMAGKFVVGYVGNLGLAQGLETALDAADRLRADPVSILVMGEGVDKPRLVALARQRGLANVMFLDGVSHPNVPAVLASCDALLVMLRDDPLFEMTIPSKLYEYMSAGKPIVCSVGGETAALISQSNCGVAVPPSDSRALADAIRTLAYNPERARALGEVGKRIVLEKYSLRRQAMAYMALLDEVVSNCASRKAPDSPLDPGDDQPALSKILLTVTKP